MTVEESLPKVRENVKVIFYLHQDLCYSLHEKCRPVLESLLKDSGATLQVINYCLSKINLSLLENEEIQLMGNRIYEGKPSKKPRRWVYLSSFCMFLFYFLVLLDMYYLQSEIATILGFFLMLIGLLTLFILICKNGKLWKSATSRSFIHDSDKLKLINSHLKSVLPSQNQRLKEFNLRFHIKEDSSIIELAVI